MFKHYIDSKKKKNTLNFIQELYKDVRTPLYVENRCE